MANRADEFLLNGEFSQVSKKQTLCLVKLTKHYLSYVPKVNPDNTFTPVCLQTSDIIGCRVEKAGASSAIESDNSTWLTIIAYPFKKKVFSSKQSRHRVSVTFQIKVSNNFEENSSLAEKWMNVINCLARDIQVTDLETCIAPVRKKMLVLINPHSGPGKALSLYKNEILPMLQDANIPHKMVVTERQGHGGEIMNTIDVNEFHGVVIISGDGLIYEVINGLMSREDWQKAIKLPVGCLPGGSGNALCCSINYSAGEPVLHDIVLHSTFVLIKHRIIPMDLVYLETPTQNIYSFLSVAWGLIADIDYESEKYRSIGEARFAIGAIKRIIGLRNYKARLSFLPVADYIPKTNSQKPNHLLTKIRRFSLRSRSSSKSTLSSQDDLCTSGQSSPDKEVTGRKVVNGSDLTVNPTDQVNGSSSAQTNNDNLNTQDQNENFHESLSKTDDSKHSTVDARFSEFKIRKETEILTAAAENDDIQIEQEVIVATKSNGCPVPTPFLTPLDQPQPDNWVMIEDNFVTVAAIYQTHLASDMLAAPDAHINDGFIYLLLVRSGISKSALLNLFMSFGEGNHVDSPYVEVIRCLAFRLEPMTPGGIIMVDGERLDPSPIQGQVLPGISRLMAIK